MSESKFLSLGELPQVRLQAGNGGVIEVPKTGAQYLLYLTDTSPASSFELRFVHPESTAQFIALVEVLGEGTPTLDLTLTHQAVRTKAETLVRTLVKTTGAPRFEGRIHVAHEALETESFLNHHSLLLSPAAKSWSRPSLEILTDQVRCSHAATLRTLEPLDLFYLRSRGISEEQARQLATNAFLDDVSLCRPD